MVKMHSDLIYACIENEHRNKLSNTTVTFYGYNLLCVVKLLICTLLATLNVQYSIVNHNDLAVY